MNNFDIKFYCRFVNIDSIEEFSRKNFCRWFWRNAPTVSQKYGIFKVLEKLQNANVSFAHS